MFTLVIEWCFNLPIWLGWMKFDVIDWFCNLSLMTFSISFPRVFNRIIGQNIFRKLYIALFGCEMIIKDDILKYDSQ